MRAFLAALKIGLFAPSAMPLGCWAYASVNSGFLEAGYTEDAVRSSTTAFGKSEYQNTIKPAYFFGFHHGINPDLDLSAGGKYLNRKWIPYVGGSLKLNTVAFNL